MYVRNASGLVRDGAKLLHILLILFIVIWNSNRIIVTILILHSTKGYRRHGYVMISRNICMKANTTALTDEFQILTHTNGFLFEVVMTYCYFLAVKTGYDQNHTNTFHQ